MVGTPVNRVDAADKVTGRAKYTADLVPRNALIAKIMHSTIAHGRVLSIDTSRAAALDGVVKVVTCFDVPDIEFPTAGHPWATDPARQDIGDRKLLNTHVRFYGDEIAAVVAVDELTAARALKLIDVEYERYPAYFSVGEAMGGGALPLHKDFPDNVIKYTQYELGNYDEAVKTPGLLVFEQEYETPAVSHCHLEPPVSFADMEGGRVVVVSATQIPHIVRRVVGQALGIPWGMVRVIKPALGGGFGNRQDVLFEPLNAWLTGLVGGEPVLLALSREEMFFATRSRHKMIFRLTTHVRPDGRFAANRITVWSDNGAYASHGHAIAANAMSSGRQLYSAGFAVKCEAFTVYTNLPTAGAMRGYGIPQMNFAIEAHVNNIASAMNIDEVEIRRLNMMRPEYFDPVLKINANSSYGLAKCIDRGCEIFEYSARKSRYKNQSGNIRRGVGMSIFCYKTGVYPLALETAGCRMSLNQDGSVQMLVGATEIGQGSDTVLSQMAAESIGLPLSHIHLASTQDTDVTPFDTGAYASRQAFVSGMAVKRTAEKIKSEIIGHAAKLLELPPESLDIASAEIIDKTTGDTLCSVEHVAMETLYSMTDSRHIAAEVSHQCKSNAFSFGACFCEVEVDVALCKVTVTDILSVHDSGRIINPSTACGQVHGGVSMSLGYAQSETILFDPETGRCLNDNLLDYKLPTMLDTPEMRVEFVETYEPSGPFGNKSLGEPPTVPPAAAVRNAVQNACGSAPCKLPMSPHLLFEFFSKEGLLNV